MAQSVFDVGDPITSRLKLGVTPDGSTNATVRVYRPDGTLIVGLTQTAWVGDEKTVQFYATDDGTAGGTVTAGVSDGDWLVIWAVTGTGASVSPKVYSVQALPGTASRPRWMPFLSDVADYAPYLTLDSTVPGAQTYLRTFTGNTTPTDDQAQRHIARVAEPIQDRWPDLTADLYRSARTYVTLRAAANIIRAFGRTAEERAGAADLTTQADAAWAEFVSLANDSTTSPTATGQVPVWAFPTPVAWGDQLL
jgi:hypothetical protein